MVKYNRLNPTSSSDVTSAKRWGNAVPQRSHTTTPLAIALWVSQWLFRHWDQNDRCSSPDHLNFELAHARSEELLRPERDRDIVSLRCSDLLLARHLLPCWQACWISGSQSCVPPSSRILEFAETGHRQEERLTCQWVYWWCITPCV